MRQFDFNIHQYKTNEMRCALVLHALVPAEKSSAHSCRDAIRPLLRKFSGYEGIAMLV